MFGRLAIVVSCLAVAVPSMGAITGTVMDADGNPVAGARVTAFQGQTSAEQRTRLLSEVPERKPIGKTETAKSGKFSLELPKEHVVADVQVEAPGYAPEALVVERDEELSGIPLTKAETKTGTITANGKPVPGARVVWWSDAELLSITDAAGRYSVPDPSKWAGRVIVIHPDYAIHEEMTRRRSATDAAVDRKLERGQTLTGRVMSADGRTPMAGARIEIDDWPLATSAEDGSFTVAHAPRQWEWITASARNLSGRRARGSDLTIRLQPLLNVTGSVRDEKTSEPITGAAISLRPRARVASTTVAKSVFSDGKGSFIVNDVAPGSYAVIVRRPGFAFMASDIEVTSDRNPPRTLLGTRLGRVAGQVLSEGNEPVTGARLIAQQVSRTSTGPGLRMNTPERRMSTPEGSFVVPVPPEQDFQIEAWKRGLPSARSNTVRVAHGERKGGVTITIPAGFTVTGRVTNRDDEPVAGVSVIASESRGNPNAMMFMMSGRINYDEYVQTAADGSFSLILKEGKYDLGFRRDGFAAKTIPAYEVSRSSRPVAVTLDPGVSISGRVVRGETGVPEVEIGVFAGGGPATTETGADGRFTIENLTPGSAMLRAWKPDEFIEATLPIEAPANDVEIVIPPGGVIAGRVIDKETKAPVTTFEAGITSARGGGGMVFLAPGQAKPFTTTEGAFVLENVPVGTRTLMVNAPGYTSATIPSIEVEEGKSTPEITVEMDRGTRITGRVTGPDGGALAGVSVRMTSAAVRGVARPPWMNSGTTTDTNGDYSIDAVEAGERVLSFSRSGFVSAEKTAEVKGKEMRVDAQLSSGMRVSGTVVDESGAPVADASVSARPVGGAQMNYSSARTDQNGLFQFEAMAPGRYNFNAGKQGLLGTELNDVDIASGAPVRLVLKAGATIYGRVIGLKPEELPQTMVRAVSSTGHGGASVDTNGNYRMEGAPTGTVRLSAFTGGAFGGGGRSSQASSVQVEPGTTVQADVEFISGTSVRGRVTRDGRPVPSAFVNFYPRSGSSQTTARTTAGGDGRYEVTGLDDATYNVTVSDAQSGASFTTTYEVRGSGSFDIDMRSSSVRGRVVDAQSGEPIGGAAINFRDAENTRYGVRTYLTDPSGVFIADSISAGSFNVTAEKEGYGTKVVELTVGDSPAELQIELTPNPGVTLRVVDARDGRTLSSSIRVLDMQDRVVYESPMRWYGSSLPDALKIGLDPGTYRAIVTAPSYAPRSVTVTSPGTHDVALSPGGTIVIRSKGSELRRGRLMGADGREYVRNFYSPAFTIDPAPGVTHLEHIAPGAYTLQVIDAGNQVVASTQVVVGEAQTATVDI